MNEIRDPCIYCLRRGIHSPGCPELNRDAYLADWVQGYKDAIDGRVLQIIPSQSYRVGMYTGWERIDEQREYEWYTSRRVATNSDEVQEEIAIYKHGF